MGKVGWGEIKECCQLKQRSGRGGEELWYARIRILCANEDEEGLTLVRRTVPGLVPAHAHARAGQRHEVPNPESALQEAQMSWERWLSSSTCTRAPSRCRCIRRPSGHRCPCRRGGGWGGMQMQSFGFCCFAALCVSCVSLSLDRRCWRDPTRGWGVYLVPIVGGGCVFSWPTVAQRQVEGSDIRTSCSQPTEPNSKFCATGNFCNREIVRSRAESKSTGEYRRGRRGSACHKKQKQKKILHCTALRCTLLCGQDRIDRYDADADADAAGGGM